MSEKSCLPLHSSVGFFTQGGGSLILLYRRVRHDVTRSHAIEQHARMAEHEGRQEAVLHDAHDGSIRLWRDYLARDHHDGRHICHCRRRLWHVEIHLVSVEIRVVRIGAAQIQPERVSTHQLDAVAHHSDFVKRWLAIEYDYVVILQKTLDYPPVLQTYLVAVLAVCQIDRHPIRGDHIFGAHDIKGLVDDALVRSQCCSS